MALIKGRNENFGTLARAGQSVGALKFKSASFSNSYLMSALAGSATRPRRGSASSLQALGSLQFCVIHSTANSFRA
jgi:hypothetical protein